MNIFTKILKYFKLREYLKYKKSSCPYCGKFHWKYCFAPTIQNGVKGTLEARICGNCGYKDTEGHFISSETKYNGVASFKTKQD